MERKIKDMVTGFRTTDGAGVSLVRVLGHDTVKTYDPILMLDSFDSVNPEEYIAGFPMHPHRGIETISYISQGNMMHKDSLGNEDMITDGEVQWMTAGSGILHEEKLPPSDRMLGVQLWLNLPKANKMTKPKYHSIKTDDIEEIEIDGGVLRLISGNYKNHIGYQGEYLPLDFYAIRLKAHEKIKLEMEKNKSVLVFLLQGNAKIAGKEVLEKTAVKLTEGTFLNIESMDTDIEVLYLSTDRLDEPVAWGGPIVMNDDFELSTAFNELRNNSFLKDEMDY